MDDSWKTVEKEPEDVTVNGNGNVTNSHDLFGVGPTVELVPDSRHTPVNGNDHRGDEAEEPRRTLFSWAEFMAEEPAKPKHRRRKPQPATISMFEWALTLEKAREKEMVGAGR